MIDPENWSEPYKVKGKWTRDWMVPESYVSSFFTYWKSNSFKLKPLGYGVVKKDTNWYLTETSDHKHGFGKTIPKPTQTQKATPPPATSTYSIKNTTGLKPWQITAVEKLCAVINTLGAAIDGSDLGTGKTYVACGVARELNMKIFIVCPKAVMESWNRVIHNHFKMDSSFVGIINYEMLRTGKSDSPFASYVRRRDTRRREFVWKIPKNTLIVWDESQKLKSASTKNSETCVAAIKSGYKMLFCSATNATNPLELKTVGTALGLFNNNKQYYEWLYEHGVIKGRFGLEFTGNKEVLKKLHTDIFVHRGVRMCRDIIPDFPDSQIDAECYSMDDKSKAEINKIYREMAAELAKLKKKGKKDSISELTEILRARQRVELVKVPLFVDMINDALENGMSVVVFLNFTETIHALSDRLNTVCIVNGEAAYEKHRQQNIDDFQADKSRIILVNISAGGAGLSLHDLNGKYPRISLISPSYSAVLMRQATGRIWRSGAKSRSIQKIVFVAKTVEEKVCESVRHKLLNMDLLNDGDLNIV